MTFFEAALHILEKEGKPLTFKYITERAITEKLLSHVGKDPEATMYYRLAAMAKRKGDRKIVATAPETFGLLDWGVLEDPKALEQNPLPQPDETEPPLRPRERHPLPRTENVRIAGRGERQRHREEREKKKKLQTLPELAFEVLQQGQAPMAAVDLAGALRDTEKVAEDLGAEALLQALRDDNRRREGQGRRPLFAITEAGEVSLERAGAPGEGIPVDLQAALAQSLGMQLEGERPAPKAGPGLQRLLQQVKEHQKNIGRVLRRRFGELELGALELVGVALLESQGFREVRATKRGKEGLVLTGRRRDGLLDVRYAARLLKGTREVSRTDVADLRRDLVNHNAHVGLVISAGEVARDARTEALGGGALMLLWCGEALGDKLLEKKVGAHATSVELVDLDESFFKRAKDQGALDDARREERRREREEREAKEKAEREARDAARAAEKPAQAEGTAAEGAPSEAAATPVAEGIAAPIDAVQAPAAAEPAAPAPEVIHVRVDLGQTVEPGSPEAIAQAVINEEPAAAPPAPAPAETDADKKS